MAFDKRKHATLTAIVTPSTKEEFKKLAKKRRWSVSNYLAYLVEKELEEHDPKKR
jgi:hypothetical protein